jgi:putative FmdB family regulatory protein
MPIYEYHCNSCDHDFEVIQKITDHPIRKCPKCGKMKAKRTISQTSFILKGSGWYVTDYAGGKSPSNHDSPSSSEKTNGNGNKSSEASKETSKESAEPSKSKASTPPAKEATT